VKLLAVETAFEPCSVALWDDGRVLERFESAPRSHAERLLPFVEDLLRESGFRLVDLDGIAFSRGPGSFTSLRIGIGVVQGLAFGADLPVWPVSSLQTVAQAVSGELAAGRAWVAMDARMGEVYSGRFERSDGLMVPAGPESVGAPEVVVPEEPERWAGVGNGFERFEALAGTPVAQRFPEACARAGDVARLAASAWSPEAARPPDRAQPVYLRNRVAEKPSGQ
jgi:tRNA threonylcarbamoyladenosine biosynthesis protein TsaB